MSSWSLTAKPMRTPKRLPGKLAGASGKMLTPCRLGSIATSDARRVRSVPSWDAELWAPKNRYQASGNPHGYEIFQSVPSWYTLGLWGYLLTRTEKYPDFEVSAR